MELRELPDIHVGHADEPRPAGSVQALHRLPGFPVVGAQAMSDRWPVENVRVEAVGTEVLQRPGERLLDLRRERRARVVGQAVVLPAEVGELRLEEDVLPP